MPATKPIASFFKTSANLETEGIWIDYGDYGRFLVARAGGKNKAFRNLMDQRLRPYRSALKMGLVDDSVIEKITRESFAEAVVLDWELVDESNQPIPYSAEACSKLFEDCPDLFEDVLNQAQTVANFVEETRVEDAKGSGSSSTGV